MSRSDDKAAYEGGEDPQAVVAWAVDRFTPDLALACSFSVEDIVVAHLLKQVWPGARVFALDTGRLNEETYACAEAVRVRLGLKIEWFFPERRAVETLEREAGLFSFRESLEARHACCRIRKVEPLARALTGLRAWVTGLRREQGVTRTALLPVERDPAHGGILKINPLAAWSSDQVWAYARAHGLPYNVLHDQGYPSIGCAPCTRAVAPGEDARAGRWWWEQPEHKECGLHGLRREPRT